MRARLRPPLLRMLAGVSKPLARTVTPASQPRRILLVRPDHIGDVLFATPALRVLRSSLPDAHIACMVGPWAVEIVQRSPHVDEILTCPFPGFTRRPKRHLLDPYLLLWSHARSLRSSAFDTAIILRFDHWWGAMLAYWAGIPRRIGYSLPATAPFLTEGVAYRRGRHEVEQNLHLMAVLTGASVNDPGPLEFEPGSDAVAAGAALLAGRDAHGGYLCIHPGAGAPVKLWRPEGFAEVGDTLARQYGLQAVITGSAEEQQLVRSVAESMESNPLTIAGKTSLSELAAVMAGCRLVIGVDSGPLHLAVSQGVPTIHLFGPVDHRIFGPWGDPKKHVALVADRDCVPCNRLDHPEDDLGAHPCVRDITEAEVLAAADTLLSEYGQPSAAML